MKNSLHIFTHLILIAFLLFGSQTLAAQHCPAGQVEVFFNLTGATGGAIPRLGIDSDKNAAPDIFVNMYDGADLAGNTDGWFQCSVCLPENEQTWYIYTYADGTWESQDLLADLSTKTCTDNNSWEGNPCHECPVRGHYGSNFNFAQRVLDVATTPLNVHETIGQCPSARTAGGDFTHYESRTMLPLPNASDLTTATDRTQNSDGWVTFWNDAGTATDFSDDYILFSIENSFLMVNGTYQHWNLQVNRAKVNTPVNPGLAQWHASDPATFINNPSGGAARMTRYWDYLWPNALPHDVGVRFYYTQAEVDAVNTIIVNNGGTALSDESEMNLYKVTSGEFPWDVANLAPEDVQLINHDGGATSLSQFNYTTVGGGSTTKYFQFDVAGFSGGGGGGVSSGEAFLPVELTKFKGESVSKEVKLSWTTATEIENDFFTLEHSTDRRVFTSIGKINGSGNTYSPTDYSFLHENPRNGVNYYRLVNTAFDGTQEYSDVISVSFENEGKLTIYPSLATTDFLNINFPGSDIKITVFNQTGQAVLMQSLDMTSGNNRIQITELPAGVYYLTAQDDNMRETVKFIKQ